MYYVEKDQCPQCEGEKMMRTPEGVLITCRTCFGSGVIEKRVTIELNSN